MSCLDIQSGITRATKHHITEVAPALRGCIVAIVNCRYARFIALNFSGQNGTALNPHRQAVALNPAKMLNPLLKVSLSWYVRLIINSTNLLLL